MKIVPMVGHPFAVEKEKLNGMLQSLASSLGSRKAKMIGDIDVWGTEGRFCGDVDGSRRCGCFVCDAGPMARWCRVDHAASRGHSKGLQRFKRDLQRAQIRATVQEQARDYGSMGPSTAVCQQGQQYWIDTQVALFEDSKKHISHPDDEDADMEGQQSEARVQDQLNVPRHDGSALAGHATRGNDDAADAHGKADEKIAWMQSAQTLAEWTTKHSWPVRDAEKPEERVMANWIHNQRQFYKQSLLSAVQVSHLESIRGWAWDAHSDAWSLTRSKLQAWCATREGMPAMSAKDDEEKGLARWVKNQRNAYTGARAPLLSEDKVKKLQEIDSWIFPMQHVTWTVMFNALKKWSDREDKLPAPEVHVQSGEKWLPLGLWLADQRAHLRNGAADKDKNLKKLHEWISKYA